MEKKLIEKTEDLIKEILDKGINVNNIDNLVKLTKIKHYTKEDMEMNYGRYGRGPGYDSYGRRYYGRDSYGENYGEYGNYGARGYDTKYRGYGHLDEMADHYGRYSENRERYGSNEDTKRSLKYMLESMEDFVKMLKEDAKSQEEMSMIRESVQRIANM